MDPLTLTIALEDDSPGYEISPARVPLSVLAAFAAEVKDFLKGTSKELDPDSVEVAACARRVRALRGAGTITDLPHAISTQDPFSDAWFADGNQGSLNLTQR